VQYQVWRVWHKLPRMQLYKMKLEGVDIVQDQIGGSGYVQDQVRRVWHKQPCVQVSTSGW